MKSCAKKFVWGSFQLSHKIYFENCVKIFKSDKFIDVLTMIYDFCKG